VFGPGGLTLVTFAILISTFGCNNGLILSGARVYYAMAADKLFFRQAGRLNERAVPGSGLWIQFAWASLLCLSGSYSQLLDYVVFAVLLFYVLTILAIFVLRIRKPDADRPYRAFGYPIIPALYILMALTIMIILLIYKRAFTWPGLIIVIIGIPVYYIWKRFNKTV
jgi:APA family basic amino acid/polyamine antiporter